MEVPTQPTLPISLDRAQEAASSGDRRLARQLCLQLTKSNPANEKAWLLLADVSDSADEQTAALGHALRLDPHNTAARQALYETMQHLLHKDAFLAYQGETSTFYRISTPEDLQFTHPKDRAVVAAFPPAETSPTHCAQRWLAWSVIGLIPAGVGALVCAPVAMATSLNLLRKRLPLMERRRAWIVLLGATLSWLVGMLLAFVLILHLG